MNKMIFKTNDPEWNAYKDFMFDYQNSKPGSTAGITDFNLAYFLRFCDFEADPFIKYLKENYTFPQTICSAMDKYKTFDFEYMTYALITENDNINTLIRSYYSNRNEILKHFLVQVMPEYYYLASNCWLEEVPQEAFTNPEVVLAMVEKKPITGKYLANDEDFLKKAVSVNFEILKFSPTRFKGRIQLMRELCSINPKCAEYANSPIPKLAGATNLHGAERAEKVLQYLTSTKEKKELKATIVRRAAKKTETKQKFKI